MSNEHKPKAFISCSLRSDDKPFIDIIENIVKAHGFESFGTVGKYDQAPEPLYDTIDKNIDIADCIVAVYTPRFIQIDIQNTEIEKKSISENILYEGHSALFLDKPYLIFVQEGTDVPQVFKEKTQYITIKKDGSNIENEKERIDKYFKNANDKIKNTRKSIEESFKFKLSNIGFKLITPSTPFNEGTTECWKEGFFRMEDIRSGYDARREEENIVLSRLKNLNNDERGIILFGEAYFGKTVFLRRIMFEIIKDAYCVLYSEYINGSEIHLNDVFDNISSKYSKILVIVDNIHLEQNEVIFGVLNGNIKKNISYLFGCRNRQLKGDPEIKRSLRYLYSIYLKFDEKHASLLLEKALSLFPNNINVKDINKYAKTFYDLSNHYPFIYNCIIRSILYNQQIGQNSLSFTPTDIEDCIQHEIKNQIDKLNILEQRNNGLWNAFLLILIFGMFELKLDIQINKNIINCSKIVLYQLNRLVDNELIKKEGENIFLDFHELRSTEFLVYIFHDLYGDDELLFDNNYNFSLLLRCLSKFLSVKEKITILRKCSRMYQHKRRGLLSKYIAENIHIADNEKNNFNPSDLADLYCFGLGTYYSVIGNLQIAIEYIDKALEIEPDNIIYFSQKGLAFDNNGRHEEALNEYEKGLRINPNFPLLWYNKGVTLFNLHQFDTSISAFDRAITLDPNDMDAINNRGRSLLYIGKYKEALNDFETVLKLDPTFYFAMNNKAWIMILMGKYEESLILIDKSITINPYDDKTWFLKGVILNEKENYTNALDAFDMAISLMPTNSEYWYKKGLVLNTLGRDSDAIASYDEAINLDSNFYEAISDKGNSYLSMGKYEEAIELFDKAKNINPNDPIIWYNKASAYYNLGKPKEAITFAIKATDLAPNYVSAWGLQLMCYLTIGDRKKADFVATKMKEINKFNTFEKTNVYGNGQIGTIFSRRFSG